MRLSARADDIKLLGYVADEHLPALYGGAAAFVLPSLYEGFGMGAIEAMACACPVVVSCAASLPEVVDDAAIIVDPRSVQDIRAGLLEAVEPVASLRLSTRGLQRAAEFTWERAARETLRTIRLAHAETSR